MVTNVTSLTGNGLKDWLIQRVTAVFLIIYAIFMVSFLLYHPHLTYVEWSALFHNLLFKLATVTALIAISLHSWVGIWTVTTDYMKCTALRLTVQMLVLAWLLGQFLWCLMIVWGR